jgi:hypothetical protein
VAAPYGQQPALPGNYGQQPALPGNYEQSPGGGYGAPPAYGPGDYGNQGGPASYQPGYQGPGAFADQGNGYPAPAGPFPGASAGTYPAPGGYPQENGYQQDSGYQQGAGPSGYQDPNGGYYQGGGYPDAGYPGGGHPQENGYPQEGGYQQGPAYPQSGAYQQGTAYPQGGTYSQDSAYQQDSGYQQGAGYQAPGYQDPGYQQGYQDPGYQQAGYGQPAGYPPQPAGGNYPALPSGGAYPGQYPEQPANPGTGGYPAADAGNDWYSGQPAAANGASFADTGSYRLNGSVPDEYGTGPRGVLGDPVRGFPPGPGQAAGDPLATSVIPAVTGAQAAQLGGPQTTQFSGAQQAQRSGPLAAQFTGPQQTQFTGPQAAPFTGSQQALRGGMQDDYDAYATNDDYATRAYGAPAPQDGQGGTGYADDFDSGRDYAGFGPGTQPPAPGDSGRGAGFGPLRGKRLLLAALAVVAVVIVIGAAYVFVLKPSSSPASSAPAQTGPLPTASTDPSAQACEKTLGTYCHIELRSDDPTALTTSALYPVAFTNETDKISYSLVSTKTDTKCDSAVIGPLLISALKAGQCTQVVRASYVSAGNKIMGTIGVVNLASTNEAHDAGKVVGKANFIAPLIGTSGVAKKLGKGTGVVEAEFKGHYLILTWSEFANGTKPTTSAQDQQLEQFGNDLVAGTANVILSQRMVAATSATASPSASPSASK